MLARCICAPEAVSSSGAVAGTAPKQGHTWAAFCGGTGRERGRVARRSFRVEAVMAPEQPRLRPDQNGRFGKFGGKYVPETLMAALSQLEAEYDEIKRDPGFQVGAPSPRDSTLHSACFHPFHTHGLY